MDVQRLYRDFNKICNMFTARYGTMTFALGGEFSNPTVTITSEIRLCGPRLRCKVTARELWIEVTRLYGDETMHVGHVGNIELVKVGDDIQLIDSDSRVWYGKIDHNDFIEYVDNINVALNDLYCEYDL